MIAKHKLTSALVVIKSIDMVEYERLQKEDRVSEAEALELCKESSYIINLIEKIKYQGDIYLVTKFACGGDLLQNCIKREGRFQGSARWFTED